MKISFLVHSLYNLGGTIRTTLTTAAALVERGHEVEIATVFRRRSQSLFSIDPRIRVVDLVDTSPDAKPLSTADAALSTRKTRVFPTCESRHSQYSALTDQRVEAFLRGCDSDVIVGTRPGLLAYLAKFAPPHCVTVAQEHLFLDSHGWRLTRWLYRTLRHFDAVTTVSIADADSYRTKMPRIRDRVWHIPNSVPPTLLPPADGDSRTIIAAGRLEQVKRYDLLLDAFRLVQSRRPDWRLRIYGHGKESASLRSTVESHGLGNSVSLMGVRTPMDAEWVKGSIAAVTSDLESFGLTIVEAMDCGLPVVSTACPYGPPEIIDNGVDGILTPADNAAAFAEELVRLIDNPSLRRSMSKAARDKAQRYSPHRVGAEYEALFDQLRQHRDKARR